VDVGDPPPRPTLACPLEQDDIDFKSIELLPKIPVRHVPTQETCHSVWPSDRGRRSTKHRRKHLQTATSSIVG
jgi:hypothetical protein